MRNAIIFLCYCCIISSCTQKEKPDGKKQITVADYFNYGDSSVQTAGIRMIPVNTPIGSFKVWTKRFGNNPRIKILLLHVVDSGKVCG